MIFRKTFRYLLKPNSLQRERFAQFAGACRWLFNRGLDRKKKVYEEEKRSLSHYDLNNELPALKKELVWLQEVHSQVLQQALKDLDSAFQHFFRRISNKEAPGYPRFKRKGEHDSFRYPQGVSVTDDKVFLPKIGTVRFKKTRDIDGKLCQATVIKEGDKWYVCFSCEIEKEVPFHTLSEEASVGIDVGLEQYATLARGSINNIEEVPNPRFLRTHLQKLRSLHRCLSRKVYKSRNWYKAKQKLQSYHVWLKNSRKDFAHKLSTWVVKNHDIIGVESLSIVSLLQSSHTALARSIADAGWRQFLACVRYKVQEYGKALIEVGRWYGSTKSCSRCGKQHELQLCDRLLRCDCGLEIGRDSNAAINIKNQALEKFRAAGMSVLKLVELPQ